MEVAVRLISAVTAAGGSRHVVAATTSALFHLLTVEKSGSSSCMEEFATAVDVGKLHLGEQANVATICHRLKATGHPELAKQLSQHRKARNMIAHPPALLAQRVDAVLSVSEGGGQVQCIGEAETKAPQLVADSKKGEAKRTQLDEDLKQHQVDRSAAKGAMAGATALRSKAGKDLESQGQLKGHSSAGEGTLGKPVGAETKIPLTAAEGHSSAGGGTLGKPGGAETKIPLTASTPVSKSAIPLARFARFGAPSRELQEQADLLFPEEAERRAVMFAEAARKKAELRQRGQ